MDYEQFNKKYGVLNYRPKYLQPINRIWIFLLCISISGLLQGALANGFLPSAFTSIENRYSLSSVAVAVMPTALEVSSLVLLLPLSYLGGRTSQPRILGIALLIESLGILLSVIPHFATLDEPSLMDNLVKPDEDIDEVGFCTTVLKMTGLTDLHGWAAVFYLSMVIVGLCNSSLWANTYDYLDKNCSNEDFVVYSAIFSMTAVWGPGLGYIMGWLLLRLPFDDVTKSSEKYASLSDEDFKNLENNSSYIGAYWLGFLLIGIVQLFAAVPILGFPQELPESARIRENKVVESYGTVNNFEGSEIATIASFADFIDGMKYLLTNPIFVVLVVESTVAAFCITSLAMFGPKLLQTVFTYSPREAALISACIIFPTSILAVIAGGIVPKVFKLTVKTILVICLIASVINFVFSLALLIPCENTDDVLMRSDVYTFKGIECNVTDCNCDPLFSNPFCLDESLSLYNPCYFGCVDEELTNCECYDSHVHSSLERGQCNSQNECSSFSFFIIMLVLSIICFMSFFGYPLTVTAIDRINVPQYRSLGFGVSLLVVRLFGTAPAPLLSGYIFDRSCTLKTDTDSGEDGSCIVYSNVTISFALLAIISCALSIVIWTVGLICHHFISNKQKDDQQHQLLTNLEELE